MPIYPLSKNPKNQNFEKMKKVLEVSSLYTCVPRTTIIWGTVPEIWSETDRIFCPFGHFFALLPLQQPKTSKFWKSEKSFWRCYNFIHKITIIRSAYDFCASWLIVVTLIQVFKQLPMVVTSLLFWLGLFSLLKVYLH